MKKVKELNLGFSDFKSLMENNNYYVDKSLLIEEVIKSQKAVLLLSRPRRFGKTLNLSMLRYFFDINQSKNLFSNLLIWQSGEEIKNERAKYPVIYLSFKDVKADNWIDCYNHIIYELSDLYGKYRYLSDSDVLYENEKEDFKKIISKNATETDYQRSLKKLTEYLSRYHKQKVVILIDEYDAPIQSGYKNYYDRVVVFMRSLLSGAFKDNQYLYKGVITGILRVSRESIFSGLNNISVHSVLNDEFSDKFGFTEAEVKQVLIDFKIKSTYHKVKIWYDGYKFGETKNIYNPWSVLNFVVSKNRIFNSYWANTSSDELIKEVIRQKEADLVRKDLIKLINNDFVEKEIEENFVFPDMETDNDLLWTLLTYSGYLTAIEKTGRKEYKLATPNYEIKTIFQDIVLKWLKADVNIRRRLLIDTAGYLVNNQIVEFEKGFRQIIGDTFSYFDSAKKPEYVYQAYVLGLLAVIGDEYIIKSNRESGEGRYDIMLIPHDKSKYGIVIEIKQINKQSNNETGEQFALRVNQSLNSAKKQIEQKFYYNELIENKISKDKIIKLPIVFAGKIPYIKKINLE